MNTEKQQNAFMDENFSETLAVLQEKSAELTEELLEQVAGGVGGLTLEPISGDSGRGALG